MEVFGAGIDLASGRVLWRSGYDQGWRAPDGGRVRGAAAYTSGSRTLLVRGSFFAPATSEALAAWAASFDPADPGAWARRADGDFSAVAVEPGAVQLVADRNGQARTYYHRDGGRVFVGNALQQMARHLRAPRVSSAGVYQLLTLKYLVDPVTLLDGVGVTSVGEVHRLDAGGFRVNVYHEPVEPRPDPPGTAAEVVEMLDAAFRAVCEKELRGGARPVLLLSGGLDSVVLLRYLAELGRDRVRACTFSLEGFAENELGPARMAARHFGVAHDEVVVRSDDFVARMVDGFATTDTSYYGAVAMTSIRATLDRGGPVPVIAGADTRLHTPGLTLLREWGLRINRRWAGQGRSVRKRTGLRWPDFILDRTAPRESVEEYVREVLAGHDVPPGSLADDPFVHDIRAALPGFGPTDTLEGFFRRLVAFAYRSQYTDDMNYLATAVETAGVQVRFPFYDHECVRACGRVPYAVGARPVFTLRSGRRWVPLVDKWPLRELMRGRAPDVLVWQRKNAPPHIHVMFNHPPFRAFVDALLASWLDALLASLHPHVAGLLRGRVEAFRARRQFGPGDQLLLLAVYHGCYLCLLHQRCLQPDMDARQALLKFHDVPPAQAAAHLERSVG